MSNLQSNKISQIVVYFIVETTKYNDMSFKIMCSSQTGYIYMWQTNSQFAVLHLNSIYWQPIENDRKRLSNLLFSHSTHIIPWQLNPQRLEEGCIYVQTPTPSLDVSLLLIYFQTLWMEGIKNIDMHDNICHEAYPHHCSETPKWIHRDCDTLRCEER